MSYDIYLRGANGEAIEAEKPHMMAGGTYLQGGTRELWLNVTYNYAPHFYRVLDAEKGVRWLYGQRAADTVDRLTEAIAALKDDWSDDYWAATEGNARLALSNLLTLAQLAPEGIWDGD